MDKSEFLSKLEQALLGEVSQSTCQENIEYYRNYISQEVAAGQSESEVISAIGDPRLIAKTIIETSMAASDTGNHGGFSSGDPYQEDNQTTIQYTDLNKWYWKVLGIGIVLLVVLLFMTVIGGIFSLILRFAWPLFIIWLVVSFFKNMRR